MEEPAEQLTAGYLQQGSARSRVGRRLVQSTLLPQGMRDQQCNADDDYKEEGCEEKIKDVKEKDEWSKSKKKKRKSPEGKINSNCRVRASTKVKLNGKEISNQEVENGDSHVIMKSDFFRKISERRQQKGQEEDQLCLVSQEEKDSFCLSPNSAAGKKTQYLKQQAQQQKKNSTTPKKKVMNNGAKKSLFKRSPPKILPEEQKVQIFPNLRSEAKMTAEENSRLSAGRPIHPFFSSWKVSRKTEEIIEINNTFCSIQGKEETAFNPIHVFETDEDNASSLDWGNWMFSEGSFPSFSSGLGSGTVVSERSVNSLQFDDFAIISNQSDTSTHQNKIPLVQCLDEFYKENENDKADSFQVLSSCPKSDAEWKVKFFQQGSCDLPENCLWTDKYQPRKAAEICGNGESVKSISEWLYLWNEKGSQTGKSPFEDGKTVEDVDYSCSLSDADSENIDEKASLKNVLLVTGPAGSGKTAAIYACAEEQGFQIIEVNASDWRNGALVKQRFGEALESQWLQHKVDNTMHPDMKSPMKFIRGITNLVEGSESEVEVIHLLDEEDSQQAYQDSRRSIDRENVLDIRTLILFEDVDVTLGEDHGFLSTIQQLARTAKRPIILTANKYNPVLPNNLDRLEVLFKMPSLRELISLGQMICAAENAQIHAQLIDHFIEYCQRDIRKTIMHLQFWCQSQNLQKGNRPKISYSPLSFDLEAGHWILPKLISWGSPSRLSELVEEEITKSLIAMEESNSSVEIIVEEGRNRRKKLKIRRMHRTSSYCIEAKKGEMLNLNCSLQVEQNSLSWPQTNSEFSDPSGSPLAFCNSEFSDPSGSPLAFARRNVRRRLGAVMSSDSEEDNYNHRTPSSSCKLGNTNCETQGMRSNSPSHCFPIQRCCLPSEQLSFFDGCKVEQNSPNCCERFVSPCVNGISTLDDVSSVPETSAFSETEVTNEMGLLSAAMTCSPHICREDVNSMINYLSPGSSVVEREKLSNSVYNNCSVLVSGDSDNTSLQGDLIHDSPIVHGEDVARGSQADCSCSDFVGRAKNLEKPWSYCPANNVDGTWRRLRDCCMDLKQHVTPELKDASNVLKVAIWMTNLISEADVLLGYCWPHLYDLLESSAWLYEKSHSHRWYDDQLQMSSTFSQHGMCFFAKEASALCSNKSSWTGVDLALEMLLSSSNTMALGKLLTLDKNIIENMSIKTPISRGTPRSKKDSSLRYVLHSAVSSRAYLALQGHAFHEYFSSLSQISRIEASRFAECLSERKQRRRRVARHYLSSGTYSLSPEDISLLSQCNNYERVFRQSEDLL